MTPTTGPEPWPQIIPHALDLDACAREPIHIPGSIQPHGHLLAVEPESLRLVHASAHAGKVLNRPLADAFGQPIDRLIDADTMPLLLRGLRTAPAEPIQIGILHLPGGSDHQAIAHRSDALAIWNWRISQAPAEDADHRIRSKSIQARLLAHMAASERFIDGLAEDQDDLLELVNADGAAILFDGNCRLIGRTPPQPVVEAIAVELAGQGIKDLFTSHRLPAEMRAADGADDTASGLLAISISQLHPSYLLWFRPELIRSIDWAGDPAKPADASGRLSPRSSFEIWKETVRGQSLPWRHGEVEAAGDFRNAIVSIVLRKAEEMAALNEELRRSNGELAAFSYSVSHDLRAPFRHVSSYAELLRSRAVDKLGERERHYLDSIIEAASSAGRLVDGLLHFSQLARAPLAQVDVDIGRLVKEVRHLLEPELRGHRVSWTLHRLPTVTGDPTMMRLVVQNMLSNAIKYSRERSVPEIEVGCRTTPNTYEIYVRDNGRGFDMAYAGKLFGVFQRLHREEEFEGIGIGLANVRRIVERHGGRVWAESELGQGATFHFSLPRPDAAEPR
ncbi:ATPase [Azospirillum thiophilum]|uniref:histidine kinase n=1 Tax=Azospirillum thiophilum TaxID=528244 RepID=A0AAC8W1B5_9PROT|nr:ATP-binding protein [Azospirillum thiophilum]ALG73350.1 ATPase [Azospirillum thiophilum]KJR63269.1 ATPase [Azospirillum thiophilum]